MNYKELEIEECCFTCKNNSNSLKEDNPCNCNKKAGKNNTKQDIWCKDYDIVYDVE